MTGAPSTANGEREARRRRWKAWALVIAIAVAVAVIAVTALAPIDIQAAGGPGSRSDQVRAKQTAKTSPHRAGESTQPAPLPPYPVEDETITLIDPSRNTPARGDVPAVAGRLLVTVIRRPVGPIGPLPLVVFAHGWDSDPGKYETLLDAWAAAGYLVAAPTFPDSADTLPGTPVSNYPDQARDISFVISSLLGGRAGPVDPTRVAVAGHSDGGTDVALLALNPAFVDSRIRAYLCLAGEIPPNVPGPWTTPTVGALLVAVGTDDEYGLLPKSTEVFQAADVAAKVMLTVAGGDHLGTFIGASPAAAAMRTETVRFLDTALGPGGTTSVDLASALSPTDDPAIALSAA